LPFPYQLLVHRTAYLYILLAPFAMAEDMGERQQRVLFGVPFVYKDELFTKTG
jgi:predicted membrane chloride channel (bestrophin family)